MMIFGKARSPQEVLNAEFLPFEKQLYIIIADADCNIHVLQFDPDRKTLAVSLHDLAYL